MDFQGYMNCMWCIVITMTTVGYGDLFPRTILGRSLMVLIAVWGIFTVSIMVVVLTVLIIILNSTRVHLN